MFLKAGGGLCPLLLQVRSLHSPHERRLSNSLATSSLPYHEKYGGSSLLVLEHEVEGFSFLFGILVGTVGCCVLAFLLKAAERTRLLLSSFEVWKSSRGDLPLYGALF